ncbi:ankyrin repeat domain-containing protein [Leptospira wolffii]|uniref:Ankyrin repeat domain-containing protein n=1 Tax=Leptospira wolffii TaxID=409998 RepID=A0ABV5BK45_9LEPT
MGLSFSNIFGFNLRKSFSGIFCGFFLLGLQACMLPQVRIANTGAYPSDYVYKGDLGGLERSLHSGFSVDTKDPFTRNYTPLMIAAREGETEIAEFLIRNGADVNAKTRDGHTALMMAVYNRNIQIVSLLLRSGADVHAKTRQGHTAWSEATLEDSTKIKELLSNAGAGK